jgi:hypothetical protein
MDRIEVLATLERVLQTPHRLVDLLVAASDDGQAINMIADEWDLTREQAELFLNQQFKLLVRSRFAELQGAPPSPTG